MWVSDINLINFRNYKEENINLHKELNIFIGNNGEGKTNILEAIYFLSLLKSHRTTKTNTLINFNEDHFEIFVSLIKDNHKKMSGYIHMNHTGKKIVKINGLNILKLSDFIGNFKAVMFSPEDMKIIKESPTIRRKFLDISISQIDKLYLNSIINYSKILSLKNSALKQKKIDNNLLDIYDEQLSIYSDIIINKRFNYINLLNDISGKIHKDISSEMEKLEIEYSTLLNLDMISNNFDIKNKVFGILKKNREIDIIRKFSNKGIHKDDFLILINGRHASQYSSQGQQKSGIISIKLAMVKIIKNITNEYPILLLDDILSELDVKRRRFLVNFIPEVQTFITSTEIYEDISRPSKVFNIIKGKVIERI